MTHRTAAPALGGALAVSLLASAVAAQDAALPTEGVAERPQRTVVLDRARVVTAPGEVIADGEIRIEDGRIVAVGRSVPRDGAAVRDLGGKTVYAGFIEIASTLGLPEEMKPGGIKPGDDAGNGPLRQQLDAPGARHWNRRVLPERRSVDALELAGDDIQALRKLGFAAALVTPESGIVRGESALVALGDSTVASEAVIDPVVAQHFAFDFAYGSEYPGSLMGAIALIRQSLYDARWLAVRDAGKTPHVGAEPALAALAPAANGRQRAFFLLDDELDVERVDDIRREFGLDLVFVGSGHEYRVLDAVAATGAGFVLPLTFPEAPALEQGTTAFATSLADLQHWEQAPANPARVAARGVPVALTTRGLDKPDETFWKNLRTAVAAGLSEDDALAALTTVPAEMIGNASLGRIARGAIANLVVADEDLFTDGEAKLYEVWVAGERHELAPVAPADAAGTWTLRWADGRGPRTLSIEGEGDTLTLAAGDTKLKARREGDALLALPSGALFGEADAAVMPLTLRIDGDALSGHRQLVDGRHVRVTGTRSGAADDVAADEADDDAKPHAIPAFTGYPAGAYRRTALPPQRTLLIRNATVWTNGDDGVLENADVLVRDGRIAAVGHGLSAPSGADEIDAQGRHVTPGIVDAHSHTAIARNLNEPSHSVTTEVRVADVIDPTDINLYRQLAGGVTAANLLHGSANAMGGQNAVIKLRWGEDADGLVFDGAPAGVKFALGENVKQSNWGDAFVTRYPQTRLGVEQIMRDHFEAARAYAAAREGDAATRRDLRLEALAEILAGERLIHIHSYRQDEILMFARMAQDYDLPVATFQHVLEGYKVADAIRDIDAGASTFADWWAYKMEVADAIPHNGALMVDVGVLTSFNSDSDEMARRLNMEAAKAVKYGGLSEEQALKLVTLNPAKQLGIADRVGAIAPGMDADLVIWSDHPLSNYAVAEQTWIDGRRYFDREEDRAMLARDRAERERLTALALAERRKALSLADGEDAKDADDAADAPTRRRGRWTVDLHGYLHGYLPARGLYHSGHEQLGCAVSDHLH